MIMKDTKYYWITFVDGYIYKGYELDNGDYSIFLDNCEHTMPKEMVKSISDWFNLTEDNLKLKSDKDEPSFLLDMTAIMSSFYDKNRKKYKGGKKFARFFADLYSEIGSLDKEPTYRVAKSYLFRIFEFYNQNTKKDA